MVAALLDAECLGVYAARPRYAPSSDVRRRAFGLDRWCGAFVQFMPIKMENVGIAVRDIEATIAFFTDLGLTLVGRDTVSGEWSDTAVGLDGNHAKIALLQTPDGIGRLELFEYIHPDAIDTEPTQPKRDRDASSCLFG